MGCPSCGAVLWGCSGCGVMLCGVVCGVVNGFVLGMLCGVPGLWVAALPGCSMGFPGSVGGHAFWDVFWAAWVVWRLCLLGFSVGSLVCGSDLGGALWGGRALGSSVGFLGLVCGTVGFHVTGAVARCQAGCPGGLVQV